MLSGGLSGIAELGSMYPIDSVRTRMQSLTTHHKNTTMYKTLVEMVTKEGYARPFRGISIVLLGTIPACALYYGAYEKSKEYFLHLKVSKATQYACSAVLATVLHDLVFNPCDVIKQRLQMYGSKHRSVMGCARAIYCKEGPRAFYRSFTTQLIMNIPVQAAHFMTYEYVRIYLYSDVYKANDKKKFVPMAHAIAGGAAGVAAAILTTPLDVVKTLLNTQEVGSPSGMFESIRKIYAISGLKGYTKGLFPRLIKTTPGCAFGWTTYEYSKRKLGKLKKKIE